MAYAVAAELQAYVSEDMELPSAGEQDRLLARASEVIDDVTLGRIDADNTDHTDAARDAACAQVEWWLSAGEDIDVSGPIQGYTIGSLQVQYGAGANRVSPFKLAPRAKRHLFLAGLLDRRVGIA